jgi:hypothetical protein
MARFENPKLPEKIMFSALYAIPEYSFVRVVTKIPYYKYKHAGMYSLGLETSFQMCRSRLGLEHFLGGLVSVLSRPENQTSRSRSLRSRLQVTFCTWFPISGSAIEFQMQNLYDRELLS